MSSAAPLSSETPIRLFDVAREMREAFADRDALRAAIDAYLRSPSSAPRLAALGRALLIDASDFREILSHAEPLLALAWGDAADMHGLRIPVPLSLSTGLAGDVRARATVEALVEGNASGAIHDGLIRFDAKSQAAIAVRVHGGIDVLARSDAERGRTAHGASFQPGAEAEIENVLLVPRAASALSSVGFAIGEFVYPWDIPSLFRNSFDPFPLAGRIVRLGGTRSISVGGRFRWGRALFAIPGADEDPVTLGAGVSGGARFSARLDGDFQIVIEPRGERRVAVSVSRRRSSQHRFHATATAYLGLDRSDGVARLALERLSGDAARIILSIEEHPERWTDLRAFFHAVAEERADRLLAQSALPPQIEAWLRSIAVDVDLRRRLRRVAASLLGEAAAKAIDGLEKEIAPAVDAVSRLIVPLHRALSRIRDAIDSAARSRIEIELALSRNRAAATEVAFTFDVDPVAAEPVFLEMLRGEFALAFRLAETGANDVRLDGGMLGHSGTLTIESSLTIAALGHELGTATILSQEWDAEVGATGDVLLGVRTSLEAERRRWRSLRSARVLVETALLAELGPDDRLARIDGDDLVTIESETEFEPTAEELREFEHRMIDLGAIAAPTRMSRELVVDRKHLSRRPYGRLEAVAGLRLPWDDLQAIAAADLGRARTTFAAHLHRWAPPPAIPGQLSRDGLPLFAWPSVLEWAGEGWPDAMRATRFHDAGATVHADVPAGHPTRVLYLYARTVLFFERSLLQLRAIAAPQANGAALHELSRALRKEHRALLRELGVVVGFVDSAVGEVLFTTMLDLLPPPHNAETYLVIRREDGRRFVYS